MKNRPPCRANVMLLIALLAAAPAFTGGAARANPAIRGYADDKALAQQIEDLAAFDCVAASSLGKTLGGRDVHLLTIGVGQPHAKPAILILGNVHEPHLIGSELAIRMARGLAKANGQDQQIQKLLREVTFYVIPRPNPDGVQRLFARPWRERAGDDRRTDDDRDSRIGEDPPDDLNGDGWITQIRVRDDAGAYMPHPKDPRVMIQADAKKNERGLYRLYAEGQDDDKDEQWNEDAADGASFNRNFTFRYPYFQRGAGPYPASERQTRLVADFAFDHPNIAVVFSFTLEDNLMHPWTPKPTGESERIKTSVLASDAPYLDFLARRYREIHGGKDAPPSPAGAGSFGEWAYFHYGRWSLGARAWWPPKIATEEAGKKKVEDGADQQKSREGAAKNTDAASDGVGEPKDRRNEGKPSKDSRGEEELNALRWLDREGMDGFVNWAPIEHPDFPDKKVEVGGFKPFYLLNPPAPAIEELGAKHVRFLVELASLLPRVKIQAAKADSLGGGVYRVAATVMNHGYLPTMSEMGGLSRQAYPLQISLDATAKAEFLQGSPRRRINRLAGNGGSSEQIWIVRLPSGQAATAKVKAWAPAVGSDEATVRLEEGR